MIQDWSNGQFIYRTNTKKWYECPYEEHETTNPFEHKKLNGLGVPIMLPMQSIFTIRNIANSKVLTYEVKDFGLHLNDNLIYSISIKNVSNYLDLEYPIALLVNSITTQQRTLLPQPKKSIRMLYDIIEALFNPTLEYSLYNQEEFLDEYLFYKENIAQKLLKSLELTT